jgi:hypothetical protein
MDVRSLLTLIPLNTSDTVGFVLSQFNGQFYTCNLSFGSINSSFVWAVLSRHVLELPSSAKSERQCMLPLWSLQQGSSLRNLWANFYRIGPTCSCSCQRAYFRIAHFASKKGRGRLKWKGRLSTVKFLVSKSSRFSAEATLRWVSTSVLGVTCVCDCQHGSFIKR